jgi:hypothetical protein
MINNNKNSISDVFDNVMSENPPTTARNPPGSTSLAVLRNNIKQVPTITENIELTTRQVNKRPINTFGRKPIQKKPIQKIPIQKKPIIVQQPLENQQKQSNLADISKKAVLGSGLFILLSIPHTSCLFEYVVANNTTIDNYKTVLLKALIFSIVFVLLSKYVC